MSNEKHVSVLFQNVDVFSLHTRIINKLCIFLFILGVIGNVLGLFIFSLSRRTWRLSSVYACLATCSSITNLLCVLQYTTILHSTSRHILRELVGQTWWGCKLYELLFSFRVISSWLTLFWMFERLICTSRGLRGFFNRYGSCKLQLMIPTIIIIIILSCVIGPRVYMYQPQILKYVTITYLPSLGIFNTENQRIFFLLNETLFFCFRKEIMDSTTSISIGYCQLHTNASVKWQKYFNEVYLGMNHATMRCLFSELIPAGTIIIFNTYIVYHLIRTYRRLRRTSSHKRRKEQSRTTSWMNIVLLLHSSLFFLSLVSHIVGHVIVVETHETWWVLLAILTNCSLNFYVYCLSGKAFRNEIHRLIQRFKTQCLYKLPYSQNRQQRSSHNEEAADGVNNFEVMLRLKNTSIDHVPRLLLT